MSEREIAKTAEPEHKFCQENVAATLKEFLGSNSHSKAPAGEISKETASKLEEQLRVGKNNDPTGLVKEFLDLSHGKIPSTKYDKIFEVSEGFVKTKDGKLELEITNPFKSSSEDGSGVKASVIKLDKKGQPEERVVLDEKGNVTETLEYRGNHTDMTNYVMKGGKEKISSIFNYNFFPDGVETTYTDVANGKKPEHYFSRR